VKSVKGWYGCPLAVSPTVRAVTMMNMTCPDEYQLSLNNQAALHNIQALQTGNFIIQGYSGTSPFSGQLLLPGYHGSPGTAATTQLSTLAAVTSSQQQQQQQLNQQLSYPAPPVLDKTSVVPPPSAVSQAKKFRPPLKTASKSNKYIPKPIPHQLGNLKTYSNPDILICGNCRELFNDLVDMLDHKKNYCKMRFTCKCETGGVVHSSQSQCQNSISHNSGCDDGGGGGGQGKRVFLKCTHCKEVFPGAWDLMFHVQNAHSLNIYSLGENNKKMSSKEQQS